MARRGHRSGMISTYHHAWLLRTDPAQPGYIWISDAIASENRGNHQTVTVTQVSFCIVPYNIGLA